MFQLEILGSCDA